MSAASQPSTSTLTSLSLPELVDYRLRHDPECTFTLFPGATSSDEPSRITYLEFGCAVQRFARTLKSDPTLKTGEVVGLIANCDTLLYITAIVGFAHAGITVFPMSPRNSGAAVNSMLRKVSAHRIMVTTSSVQTLLDDVKRELAVDNYHLDVMELPSLADIYPRLASETEADAFEPVPMANRDVFTGGVVVYIHSSGSTGFPKPIPWTHDFISSLAHITSVKQAKTLPEGTVMAAPGLPSFHTMGLIAYLLLPMMNGRPGAMFRPLYPQPPQITSPETILEAIKAVHATVVVTVPSILEELSHDESAIDYLKTLSRIGFGGGPLAKPIGDKLAKAGCRIRSVYGSTECGIVTSLFAPQPEDKEDWEWVSFPDNLNISWAKQDDGSAELRLLPCETHALAVQNMPGPEGGYASSDLWIEHPEKAGLWKIVGRVDDVLILANGEKVVPAPTEGALLAHPFVRSALMFGRERNQVGILVEPVESHEFDTSDESALAAFRNSIWATVEEANANAPAFGRVYKEMILVVNPGKPLPRAAKGTVNRKAAIKAYEQEINAIYDAVERPAQGSSVAAPEAWTREEVLHWLTRLASSIREGSEVKRDVDLFQQGFDSLSATFLRNNITAALRASSDAAAIGVAKKIGPNFIYSHPVLNDMAAVIVNMLRPEGNAEALDPVASVRAMIQRYTQDMATVHPSNTSKPGQDVVLLTGSTGGLGSQMLIGLLADSKVGKVYALNRASARSSSLERHQNTFEDRGLGVTLLQSPKLVFLEGEASLERLGLASDQYEELRSSVTIVIHNAWQLNFNLSLASFEPHIRGTRHLVDLALSSHHAEHVRVLLTSTIAVSQSWPRERGAFPEEPQDDPRWCIGNGYGEGKYVAEQILVEAIKHGLQTTSFRIGQIAGGYANGAWATTDWVPIMLASAVSLGSLPDAAGLASWTPFDTVSQAILDVALASGTPEKALNLVHPQPVSWSTIMDTVAHVFVEEGITTERLPLLSVEDWVEKLTELSANADAETLQRVPAVKLLDFFGAMAQANTVVRSLDDPFAESGGLTRLSTEKARSASYVLDNAVPLGAADIQRWVRYWVERGLLMSRK